MARLLRILALHASKIVSRLTATNKLISRVFDKNKFCSGITNGCDNGVRFGAKEVRHDKLLELPDLRLGKNTKSI